MDFHLLNSTLQPKKEISSSQTGSVKRAARKKDRVSVVLSLHLVDTLEQSVIFEDLHSSRIFYSVLVVGHSISGKRATMYVLSSC